MGLFLGIRSYFNKSTDYFKQAKTNQEDAVKDASNTLTSTVETAQDSMSVGAQIIGGFVAYDYIAGKTMTAYSANALAGTLGVSTPTVLSTIVNGAATFIFKYPAAALGGTIGAFLFVQLQKKQ